MAVKKPKKRSFNGCWTCRDRRVKCDQARPICNHCRRLKLNCEYSIRLTWLPIQSFNNNNLILVEEEDKKNFKSRSRLPFVKWEKPYETHEDIDDDLKKLKLNQISQVGPFGLFFSSNKRLNNINNNDKSSNTELLCQFNPHIDFEYSIHSTNNKNSTQYIDNDIEIKTLNWVDSSLLEYHLLEKSFSRNTLVSNFDKSQLIEDQEYNYEQDELIQFLIEKQIFTKNKEIDSDKFKNQYLRVFELEILNKLTNFHNDGVNFWSLIFWKRYLQKIILKNNSELNVIEKLIILELIQVSSFYSNDKRNNNELLISINVYNYINNIKIDTECKYPKEELEHLVLFFLMKIQFDNMIGITKTLPSIFKNIRNLLSNNGIGLDDFQNDCYNHKLLTPICQDFELLIKVSQIMETFHKSLRLFDLDEFKPLKVFQNHPNNLSNNAKKFNNENDGFTTIIKPIILDEELDKETGFNESSNIPKRLQKNLLMDNDLYRDINEHYENFDDLEDPPPPSFEIIFNYGMKENCLPKIEETVKEKIKIKKEIQFSDKIDSDLLIELSFGIPMELIVLFESITNLITHQFFHSFDEIGSNILINFPKICIKIEESLVNWKTNWIFFDKKNEFLSKNHELTYHHQYLFYHSLFIFYFANIKDMPSKFLKFHGLKILDHIKKLNNCNPNLFPILMVALETQNINIQKLLKSKMFFTKGTNGHWKIFQACFEVWRQKSLFNNGFIDDDEIDEISWIEIFKNLNYEMFIS